MHTDYRDDKNDVPKKLPTPLVHDPSLPDSLRANRDLQRNRKGVIEAVQDLFGASPARPNDDLVESHLSVGLPTKTRPKHRDGLARVFLTGRTIPTRGNLHTTQSRDFPNVTPLQLPPITCGRRLSRNNLVAGRLLRYPIVTHLLDDAGERLCCVQDGPTAPAPALLDGTCAADMRYCGSCARAVLTPIVQREQSRCGDDALLDATLALTTTPPTRRPRSCASSAPPWRSSTPTLSRPGGAMPSMSGATTFLACVHGRLSARRGHTRFIELERESVCVTATNPEQEEA